MADTTTTPPEVNPDLIQFTLMEHGLDTRRKYTFPDFVVTIGDPRFGNLLIRFETLDGERNQPAPKGVEVMADCRPLPELSLEGAVFEIRPNQLVEVLYHGTCLLEIAPQNYSRVRVFE